MSRRHSIDTRISALGDIGKIVRAMKNLSYMETRKLARFIEAQQLVVDGIDSAAHDLLDHHAALLEPPPQAPAPALCVLIGAERGLCGGFVDGVRDALDACTSKDGPAHLIVVGSRLAASLVGDARVVDNLAGASVVEEVPTVLSLLVQSLDAINARFGTLNVDVVHWDAATDSVQRVRVLPPFRRDRNAVTSRHPYPPRLNLAPAHFLAQLVEHYLFATLHALLYGSLQAEHQQRIRHLEGALGRIDERVRDLTLTRNTVRQEEITEEIELILLNRGDDNARPPAN